MKPAVYDKLCRIVYDEAGISLGADRQELVTTRLGKRLRALRLPDESAYLDYLEQEPSELMGLIDVITTNFTSFNRGGEHFQIMSDYLSTLVEGGQRRLRLWSAAASTGVEAYSMLMALAERYPLDSLDVRVLGTDISTTALSSAIEGVYSEKQIEPVPVAARQRYFDRTRSDKGDFWTVSHELKSRCVFRIMNLAKPPFPLRGPLDIIFCRNVMIYFDNHVRQVLVSELERLLRPGGILFIGHSETLTGLRTGFTVAGAACYRKPEGGM